MAVRAAVEAPPLAAGQGGEGVDTLGRQVVVRPALVTPVLVAVGVAGVTAEPLRVHLLAVLKMIVRLAVQTLLFPISILTSRVPPIPL